MRNGASFSPAIVVTLLVIVGTPGATGADSADRGRRFGPARSSVEGPWTGAVNLGPVVNADAPDSAPAISPDGLSLYFQSGRHLTDPFDLYVARRAAIDLPWEAPMNLGAVINSSAPDTSPYITPDAHFLLFASSRSGNFDIYVSYRSDPHDDFGWGPPVALPPPINGPSFDAGPSIVWTPGGRPQLFFASDRANGLGQAGMDIYMSELQRNGDWSGPEFLAEINSPAQDNRPAVRADGLELIFSSTRDGNLDIYASHRGHRSDRWSVPERLGLPVNTEAPESQPALSANGRTLYFASSRPGGGFDIYASTRRTERTRDE